jgi:hypothetical protein
MTATTLPTVQTTDETTAVRPMWRTGAKAGVVAAVATTAVAVAAKAVDIPVTIEGEAIPVLGFAQLTLVCTAIGIGIARLCRGSRTRFVRIALALTALSFVPDLAADASTATKLTLMLTHVVAAAIVIPAIAGRMTDERV